MKEEKRNIPLTLSKAKEWFKKGGELKEIALQAYDEKELKEFKYTWENCFSKDKEGYTYLAQSTGSIIPDTDDAEHSHTSCTSEKEAKSLMAFAKLTHIVKKLNEDFPTKEYYGCDKKIYNLHKHHPYFDHGTNEFKSTHYYTTKTPLFVYEEKACEILIRDNEQLLKDYFMIE